MQPGSYCGSSFGERASERQRRLAVNQFGPSAHRRFESCRSHIHKRDDGIRLPPSPNWSGTGLVARLCRATPAAGGSGNPLRVPGCPSPRPGTQIGDRLTAGRQVLTLFVEVRILVPERFRCATNVLSDNRIVDDARGRAPPRPRSCPRSRSGDGACLKRRRCWFDSRRGHHRGTLPSSSSCATSDRLEMVISLRSCVP